MVCCSTEVASEADVGNVDCHPRGTAERSIRLQQFGAEADAVDQLRALRAIAQSRVGARRHIQFRAERALRSRRVRLRSRLPERLSDHTGDRHRFAGVRYVRSDRRCCSGLLPVLQPPQRRLSVNRYTCRNLDHIYRPGQYGRPRISHRRGATWRVQRNTQPAGHSVSRMDGGRQRGAVDPTAIGVFDRFRRSDLCFALHARA